MHKRFMMLKVTLITESQLQRLVQRHGAFVQRRFYARNILFETANRLNLTYDIYPICC